MSFCWGQRLRTLEESLLKAIRSLEDGKNHIHLEKFDMKNLSKEEAPHNREEAVKKLLEYMPDWRINKSVKEFMLVYQGDVKLGYDLKDIKIHVDAITRTIFIYLPEPKILSHSIDFESIQVFLEKKGWFNDIKFEDFKQFFVAEQKKYEEENNDELKRRAREHAKKIILLYLGTVVKLAEEPGKSEKTFFERWLHPEDGYRINLE